MGKIWSEEHESFYYWHKATKKPSWERPAAPVKEEPPAKGSPKGGKTPAKGTGKAATVSASNLWRADADAHEKVEAKGKRKGGPSEEGTYGGNPGRPAKSQYKGNKGGGGG